MRDLRPRKVFEPEGAKVRLGYGQRLKLQMVLVVIGVSVLALGLVAFGLVQAFEYHRYVMLMFAAFGLWALRRFASGIRKLVRLDPAQIERDTTRQDPDA